MTTTGRVGPLTAYGDITGTVTAGGTLGQPVGATVAPPDGFGVWAWGKITGTLTAGAGDLSARAWDAVTGTLRAWANVTAWSWTDMTAKLTSDAAGILAGGWTSAGGTLTATKGGIDLRSRGAIAGAVAKAGAEVLAWAKNVSGLDIEAGQHAAVFGDKAISNFGGKAGTDLVLVSDGDVDTAKAMEATLLFWSRSDHFRSTGSIDTRNGNVTIDTLSGISAKDAQAGRNVWLTARQRGDIEGEFTADEGWAYAWAFESLKAITITAKENIHGTSGTDVDGTFTSHKNGVKIAAGGSVLNTRATSRWISIEAADDVLVGTFRAVNNGGGDLDIRAGGDIQGTLEAGLTIEISAGGDIDVSAESRGPWIDIVANGAVDGSLKGNQVAVQAGKAVTGQIEAIQGVWVNTTTGIVDLRAISESANVRIDAGGKITGIYEAGADAFLHSQQGVNAIVTAEVGAEVFANGDISGTVTAKWVVDVRTRDGKNSAAISTTGDSKSADSPTGRRLAVIEAQLADLIRRWGETQSDALRTILDRQIAELRAEQALLEFEPEVNWDEIPADRIRALLADGRQAVEYQGGVSLNGVTLPNGYVAFADILGRDGIFMIFEPMEAIPVYGSVGEDPYVRYEWRSLLNTNAPATHATHYKVVKSFRSANLPDPEAFLTQILSPQSVRANVAGIVEQGQHDRDVALLGALEIGIKVVPFVGSIDDFVQGNYHEGMIGLAGDLAMFTGFVALRMARDCRYAGKTITRVMNGASLGLEGGAAAARGYDGVRALSGQEYGQAALYFGDALLRVIGLSAQAIAFKNTKPLCFVAGTPVDTERGQVPIEQVTVGDRVWALDRHTGTWHLRPVLNVFERVSETLVTLDLDDASQVVGTSGHPFWVIEGDDLGTRAHGREGGDEAEMAGVPGRWVAMHAVRAGDVLLGRAGTVRVRAVGVESRGVVVYNLHVEDLHAYAVGWSGLLTHNASRTPGDYGDVGPSHGTPENARQPDGVNPEPTSNPQRRQDANDRGPGEPESPGRPGEPGTPRPTSPPRRELLEEIFGDVDLPPHYDVDDFGQLTHSEILDLLPVPIGDHDPAHGVLWVADRVYFLGSREVANGREIGGHVFYSNLAPATAVNRGIGFTDVNYHHLEGTAMTILHKLALDGVEMSGTDILLYTTRRPCGQPRNRSRVTANEAVRCHLNLPRMKPPGAVIHVRSSDATLDPMGMYYNRLYLYERF